MIEDPKIRLEKTLRAWARSRGTAVSVEISTAPVSRVYSLPVFSKFEGDLRFLVSLSNDDTWKVQVQDAKSQRFFYVRREGLAFDDIVGALGEGVDRYEAKKKAYAEFDKLMEAQDGENP